MKEFFSINEYVEVQARKLERAMKKEEAAKSPEEEIKDLKHKLFLMQMKMAEERFEASVRYAKERMKYIPDRIIKNGPATIVFWCDGTKTVVKCGEGDSPDDYAAFCAALGKKVFGSNSNLKRIMRNATDDVKQGK